MTLLRLEFPIDARPKQRARVAVLTRRGKPMQPTTVAFTPEATRLFEQEVRIRAKSQLARLGLSTPVFPGPQPVFCSTTFHLRRPKSGVGSMSETPTSSADLDNLMKALWDSLGEHRSRGELVKRGVLWTDDSQVVHSQDTKLWVVPGEIPRIEMVVADRAGMIELVQSESASAIKRLSRLLDLGAASFAASLLWTQITRVLGALAATTL